MKKLLSLTLFCHCLVGGYGATGDYAAVQLSDKVFKNIYDTIDKFVEQKSIDHSGQGAGVNFEFSCNESAYGKVYCSFSYSDGGGLTGLGFYIFDDQGKNGKPYKIIND